jgi:hypothetical protein
MVASATGRLQAAESTVSKQSCQSCRSWRPRGTSDEHAKPGRPRAVATPKRAEACYLARCCLIARLHARAFQSHWQPPFGFLSFPKGYRSRRLHGCLRGRDAPAACWRLARRTPQRSECAVHIGRNGQGGVFYSVPPNLWPSRCRPNVSARPQTDAAVIHEHTRTC